MHARVHNSRSTLYYLYTLALAKADQFLLNTLYTYILLFLSVICIAGLKLAACCLAMNPPTSGY